MEQRIVFFRKELLDWYKDNARVLPWKKNKDPYAIWLSEIILQQTRVEQGTPYFLKFIKTFPHIKNLAEAELDAVMSLWEGLGYYSRARNMHFTAQYIHRELDGIFPCTYDEILKLKGIGPYTAAAISSFAYDLVYPVVDGNVIRLLSRYFGITDFVDDTAVIKLIRSIAEECISKDKPSDYNQAIMDFGSAICSPKGAKCKICVLSNHCQAFLYDQVSTIPAKGKKIKKRNRFFHFLVISDSHRYILEKRIEKDIWRELYQFPLIESIDSTSLKKESIIEYLNNIGITDFIINPKKNKSYKQTLTHQNISAVFIHIEVNEVLKEKSLPYYLVYPQNLKNFAFPKIMNTFINESLKSMNYDQ